MMRLLVATAALAALPLAGQAADLGAPRTPVAAAIAAPAFSWSGFYVGADIGYWTSSTNIYLPGPTFNGSPNPQGIKLGAHLGYRHQYANNVVVGIEGDLSWLGGTFREATMAGSLNLWRVRATWDGSLRATLGYALDRALIYTTGGVSLIESRGCAINAPGTACVIPGVDLGGTRVGWTVGAGLAYAISPNVSVRGEYLYANYGTRNYPTPGLVGGVTSYRLDTHTFRLGVSYTFSTGPSAVVARY